MGVLDLLILNTDRNENNVIIDDNGKLFLIDHGLAFPYKLELYTFDFTWATWPQVKEPFSEEMKEFILNFDVDSYIEQINDLEHLNLSESAIFLLRFVNQILKNFTKRNATLYDIMKLITRDEFGKPSQAEIMLNQVQEKYSLDKIFSDRAKQTIQTYLKRVSSENFQSYLLAEKDLGLPLYLADQGFQKIERKNIEEDIEQDTEFSDESKDVEEIVKIVSKKMLLQLGNTIEQQDL